MSRMRNLKRVINKLFSTQAKQIHNDYNRDKIPKTTLYHYTKSCGLKGILKDQIIWFKNYKNLDDKAEIEFSIENTNNQISNYLEKSSFKDFWRTFLKKYPDHRNYHSVYTCSFCEARDHEYAWKKYGDNGKGYAIGFHRDYFQPKEKNKGNTVIIKINYDSRDFNLLIDRFLSLADDVLAKITMCYDYGYIESINKQLSAHLASALIPLMPGLKKEDFNDEKEYRLYEGEFYPNKISSSRKISEEIVESEKFSCDDICEIWVGPCANFESAKIEIKNILRSSGYDESKIKILRSNLSCDL